MKIISSSKEVYDMYNSHDDTIVFKRECTVCELESSSFAANTHFKYVVHIEDGRNVLYLPVLVGYCGKVFEYFLRIVYKKDMPTLISDGSESKFKKRYGAKTPLEYYVYERSWDNNIPLSNNIFGYGSVSEDVKGNLKKLYSEILVTSAQSQFELYKSLERLFKEKNCAYFMISTYVYWNKHNREFMVQDIPISCMLSTHVPIHVLFPEKSVEQAHQEIEYYVANVLNPKEVYPVDKIPDVVQQYAKGFDHDYAFRKEKQTKKERK